ncbi:MAG TPA: 3-hydroxybutyrate dehydrogenase [Candidatus Dormibacteraeota bacterium]|nr:3-hydroxybutyrate dehydrogenase [Candidatus Dormibacteraeota bacterium]
MAALDARGRVTLVTGGSRGIGRAIAAELAKAGSDLAILDLDLAQAEAAAGELAMAHGVRGRGYALDVRDAARAAAVCELAAKDLGGIDHVINNAGVQHVAPLPEFPEDKWNFVIEINLNGMFHVTKAAWPYLLARKRGRIVNIASVHGLVASPFKPAYIAAKHGAVGLTKAAALEGAEHGITVNAICPGAVMTDIIRNQIEDLRSSFGGNLTDEQVLEKAFLYAMPTKKMIDPEEVGALAAFLCSDAARSITGAAIPIDGGWSAH